MTISSFHHLNRVILAIQGSMIHDVSGPVRETCDTILGGELRATEKAVQRCGERVYEIDSQKDQQQLVEQFLIGQLEMLRTLHEGALKLVVSSTEADELI